MEGGENEKKEIGSRSSSGREESERAKGSPQRGFEARIRLVSGQSWALSGIF